MNEGISAVADIATGAVIARAVEPQAGEGVGTPNTGQCLNCGTELLGQHCHNCGQKGHVHRTLASFGHDILHGVFHFEGKILRSLPMLAWNPGHLTRRYVHGERAKFISPLALFLFTVFLTFAVFNSVLSGSPVNIGGSTTAEKTKQFDREVKRKRDSLAELRAERSQVTGDKAAIADYDQQIAEAEADLEQTALKNTIFVEKIRTEQADYDSKIKEIDATIAELKAQIAAAKLAGKPTEKLETNVAGQKFARSLVTKGADALNDPTVLYSLQDANFFWNNKKLNDMAKHALTDPKLLAYKVQSNAYKFSWALIPISVPFIWLLFFWRREFKVFDHAVFATYSITFMLLWSSLIAIVVHYEIGHPVIMVPMILFPMVHMYRQLKQAYQLTRLGALWRSLLMGLFAIFALTAFSLMIFYLGISG
jgi:Protein of unknown function (DUF3667)